MRELDGWRTSGIVQTESESESVVSYVVCSFALVCGTIHSDHCKEKDDALILVELMFVVSRDALDRHETLRYEESESVLTAARHHNRFTG